MQKCKDLIDKNTSKYMLNIKPTAPKINAYIKHIKIITLSDRLLTIHKHLHTR